MSTTAPDWDQFLSLEQRVSDLERDNRQLRARLRMQSRDSALIEGCLFVVGMAELLGQIPQGRRNGATET